MERDSMNRKSGKVVRADGKIKPADESSEESIASVKANAEGRGKPPSLVVVPPTDGNRLLRANEVAGRLGVSVTYAYDLLKSGQVPVIRVGRKLRCSSKALDKWIEENTTVPVSG